MRRLTVLAGILGVGLTAWMLAQFGAAATLTLVAAGGWGVLFAILFHSVQVLLSAHSWRVISGRRGADVQLRDYALLRCVREGVNNLLPVAQIGGEVASARLLGRRGLGLRHAAAATICDLTIELLSQVAFTVVGLLILFLLVKRSTITDELMESGGVALLIGVALFGSQWFGAISVVERLLVRIAAHLGWSGVDGIRGLHDEIMSLYRAPRRAIIAGCAQFAGWSLGAVEVCIILHFLGHDRSLATGYVIESVGQIAKSVAFAVPGGLGVSEGGYVLVGGLFGLPPTVSIALSLIKRLREIAWGLPSLAAWQYLEHRWRPVGAAPPVSARGG
ncbi:flippase-like domain-containing protein [Acetobacter sacchari]|uniref:Flippase-like domain-containing protein n=1 Tax=Acetobacter sacchari TaxID=2661687 RepID=A0ABS3LQW2_9PROT|nr:lysylphosphatidylglycerol synthase domain-containing protein [Acetobacter sacchari]MBO1358300.1 flippase-like domain-containing protein [Acetobacter sacchari]